MSFASEQASVHLFRGSNLVAAPPERVWAMLQDPQVLQRVVPGLSEVVAEGGAAAGGQLRAQLSVNVGPVRGKFKTLLRVTEARVPEQLSARIEGRNFSGAVMLELWLRLTNLGGATRVDWQARPSVTGLLSGVGGKLIERKAADAGAGQRYGDQFFGRLAQEA